LFLEVECQQADRSTILPHRGSPAAGVAGSDCTIGARLRRPIATGTPSAPGAANATGAASSSLWWASFAEANPRPALVTSTLAGSDPPRYRSGVGTTFGTVSGRSTNGRRARTGGAVTVGRDQREPACVVDDEQVAAVHPGVLLDLVNPDAVL
jgi:hypothetical protein